MKFFRLSTSEAAVLVLAPETLSVLSEVLVSRRELEPALLVSSLAVADCDDVVVIVVHDDVVLVVSLAVVVVVVSSSLSSVDESLSLSSTSTDTERGVRAGLSTNDQRLTQSGEYASACQQMTND